MANHRSAAKPHTAGVDGAIYKHGWSAFKLDILQQCDDQQSLDEAERYWIKHLNTHVSADGYNIDWGGKGGGKKAECTIAKMSAAQMGHGHGNGQTGKKRAQWVRDAMSSRRRGVKQSAETIEKRRKTMTGKKRGPYKQGTGANISKGKTGRKTGPHTQERVAKIAAGNRGKKRSAEQRTALSALKTGLRKGQDGKMYRPHGVGGSTESLSPSSNDANTNMFT
tara:strand:- start:5987 stop:6655 length:669 start_codon:yes stop_codon:yes gene_type:complete